MVHAPRLGAAKPGALSKTPAPLHQGACRRGGYLGQPQGLGSASGVGGAEAAFGWSPWGTGTKGHF